MGVVRDDFRGKSVERIIDLPFALPTIVAGLVVLRCTGRVPRSASTSPTHARRS
jgi:ABC-type sulfate transport system permease component